MSRQDSSATPPAAEPFLSRWSRRKLERDESPAVEESAVADPPAPSPELTDADMPPLESLDEHSDYSGFLSPKVSEALRQQALQQFFRGSAFNVCDGLDDYAEDFTRFEKLGDLITSDLRYRLEQEARRAVQQSQSAAAEAREPQTAATPAADEEAAGTERSGQPAEQSCDSGRAESDKPESTT